MPPPSRERGAILALLAALLAIAITAVFTTALASVAGEQGRSKATERALATAREALIAYATSRPIDAVVGPGYLPCPDRDDDGWAEPTCGSMSGDTGQWQRLGRLPWKTLGLPDLRDGSGERLWYAVSSKHKGLLNCTVSVECLDLSPESALGTITVRDASGTVIHDGTSASPYDPGSGGAVAVVIAPGPPLARWNGLDGSRRMQVRTCEGGRCGETGRCLTDPPTLTPKCDPANYLDRSPGPAFADEDNARFIDRNDVAGRTGNRDGFIQGPIVGSDGTPWVNDRIAIVSYDDLMPRVMRRVGEEVASCLQQYADHPAHAGRTPWAAPTCRSLDGNALLRGADASGVRFGRIPDTPFAATERDSGGALSPQWHHGPAGCHIADAAGRTAGLAAPSWWNAWKRHVFYAMSEPAIPSAGPAIPCDARSCLVVGESANGQRFAVVVAGPPLSRDGGRQSRGALASLDAREWLEGSNAELRRLNANPAAPECSPDPSFPPGPGSSAFNRLASGQGRNANDAVVTPPPGARP
jgi:type II secretory pathway pseudopilin PulG